MFYEYFNETEPEQQEAKIWLTLAEMSPSLTPSMEKLARLKLDTVSFKESSTSGSGYFPEEDNPYVVLSCKSKYQPP